MANKRAKRANDEWMNATEARKFLAEEGFARSLPTIIKLLGEAKILETFGRRNKFVRKENLLKWMKDNLYEEG